MCIRDRGQVVRARITEIDFEKKRISLSTRVLIEEGLAPSPFADEDAQEAEAAPAEEVPAAEEPAATEE